MEHGRRTQQLGVELHAFAMPGQAFLYQRLAYADPGRADPFRKVTVPEAQVLLHNGRCKNYFAAIRRISEKMSSGRHGLLKKGTFTGKKAGSGRR